LAGTGHRSEPELELAWRLAAIIESSPDAILGGTLDGVITFWSRSATRIMGYTADEMVGRRASMMVPADRVAEFKHVLEQVQAGNRAGPFNTKRVRKDGTLVDLSVSVSPVLDTSGKVVGAATVARDITELLRAEEEHRALETQLQQTERMESVGQLASGIAHDFKNLLSIVVGYAERAEDLATDQDLELQATLREIRIAADRAVALTDDLLAFSSRTRATPSAVDLKALIAGMREMLSLAVGARAKVVIELPPGDLPAVLAEPGRLEQVLLNLAVNARDAMPEGGTLTITPRRAPVSMDRPDRHPDLRPGRYVELAVTDSGTGMSAEVSGRIFERFFTTKPPGAGTGLGLSAVHGIIADVGGRIEVDSAEGCGTTFRIYLPVVSSPARLWRPAAGH
jgi:PAS domain S-box-containing protein